uniref:Brevinin-1OKb n=1 Tax=Nidirana okinavana TaxID=156870 RepID=BR1B_NIDOK|nr:RecName: Full=Brevinin-1OKb [Nidirana okinavana]
FFPFVINELAKLPSLISLLKK